MNEHCNNSTEVIDVVPNELWLNDSWCMYFHDPYDDNWNRCGYVRIGSISKVDEFWTMYSLLEDELHKGMFFLMREHIFPTWNDEENKDGGFLSIKVLKNKVKTFCENMFIDLINETLLINEKIEDNWSLINGVSISPKKHFCIIKIWLKDKCISDSDFFNIEKEYYGDIIYKDNTCV